MQREPLKATLRAELGRLGEMMSFVSSAAREFGLGDKKVSELELVTEEAFVNVCNHAYKGGGGDVTVTFGGTEDGKYYIEIEDAGVPFDPGAYKDPDITQGIEERKIGGLGIFFMKQLMDEVKYARRDDKNVLTLVVSK